MQAEELLKEARSVLAAQVASLQALSQSLGSEFVAAAELLARCPGRIVCCGMGKSGIIAKKIVATLASTGNPALFLHPCEAIHGDLGMLMPGDCFLSLSNSGETDELLQLIPHIQQLQLPHICITAKGQSTLAAHADRVLLLHIEREGSQLASVPMASTTASLALGDALAAVLMAWKRFRQEDFARNHPGGSIGRKLLGKVAERMKKLPLLAPQTQVPELLLAISEGRMGMAAIGREGEIQGIITDGDLRRAMAKAHRLGQNFFAQSAKELMSTEPKRIDAQASLIAAEELMNRHKISVLLVCDSKGNYLGAVSNLDLG